MFKKKGFSKKNFIIASAMIFVGDFLKKYIFLAQKCKRQSGFID